MKKNIRFWRWFPSPRKKKMNNENIRLWRWVSLLKENEQTINLVLEEAVFLAKEECGPKIFVPSRRKDVAI
jgi:hypothetical protein